MSAVFGRLQDETLDLGNGLNILQAPNETGKSTWCAFLLSMLYGINSRERERAGYIPDKIRYAPWSGAAMSGRLECRAEGRELTITRSTRRRPPLLASFGRLHRNRERRPGATATVLRRSSAGCQPGGF